MEQNNKYTQMQKDQYNPGTSNHEEHNSNQDYWDILLGDLKNTINWNNKIGLDFACGKGRNVTNMLSLCDWNRVDGVDISSGNIEYNIRTYAGQNSNWYCNNGVNVADLNDNEYDFIMSTIALQHIPVYEIRKSLITDLLRVLKPGGVFSFQMGYGNDLHSPVGSISRYHENSYDARGTNSVHDVRVFSEEEVTQDLEKIGYVNVTTQVRNSHSDIVHPQWIFVKAYKPE
jgi:SAM-dependent methyltransferase